jgi:hypothetical protein
MHELGKYVILIIGLVIVHMYIFGPDNAYIGRTSKIGGLRYSLLQKCLVKCQDCKITTLRDSGYFEGAETDEYNKDCLLTGWEVSHFALHFLLGLFNYSIYTSQGISIGYEIYERYEHNCASYGDLIINLSGYLVGRLCR